MSEHEVEANADGRGCLLIIGAVILAICIGNLYEAVYGWLALGSALVVWAVFSRG